MCDSARIEVRHDRTTRYRYLKREYLLEGQEHTICLDCSTSFYQEGQIQRNNQRLQAFAATVVKHIAPWDIRAMRERYGLSQADAAQIFGCGPRAFSKWERGEVAPTGATARLLKLALNHPEVLAALAQDAGLVLNLPVQARVVTVATARDVTIYWPGTEVLMSARVEDEFTTISPAPNQTPWIAARDPRFVHPMPNHTQ